MIKHVSTLGLGIISSSREMFREALIMAESLRLASLTYLDIEESIRDCRTVYIRRQKQKKEQEERERHLASLRQHRYPPLDTFHISATDWTPVVVPGLDSCGIPLSAFHCNSINNIDVITAGLITPPRYSFRVNSLFSTADILTFFRNEVEQANTPFKILGESQYFLEGPASSPSILFFRKHQRTYPFLSQTRDGHLTKVKLQKLPIPDT